MTSTTIGTFNRNVPEEFLTIKFSPSSRPLRERWENNGLSAGFITDYWSIFSPASEECVYRRIREAVTFITNELLENTMKFSFPSAQLPVELSLYISPTQLYLYTLNAVDPAKVADFQQYLEKLLSWDIDQLYHELLSSRGALAGSASGLGLLTIRSNYPVDMGWKFKKMRRWTVVTTMIRLDLQRFIQGDTCS